MIDHPANTRTSGDTADEYNRDGVTLVGEELVLSNPSPEEPVIDGESVAVPPGAVTALVGPNGSSKSRC